MRYEYIVIPAPQKGEKAKGAKTPTDRYALSMAAELNRMAAEGWDYVRAETLPSEERSGLTGRSTVYHNILVFRRAAEALQEADAPASAESPKPEYPAAATAPATPEPTPHLPEAAAPHKLDDGVRPIANPVDSTAEADSADQAVPPKPRQPDTPA